MITTACPRCGSLFSLYIHVDIVCDVCGEPFNSKECQTMTDAIDHAMLEDDDRPDDPCSTCGGDGTVEDVTTGAESPCPFCTIDDEDEVHGTAEESTIEAHEGPKLSSVR